MRRHDEDDSGDILVRVFMAVCVAIAGASVCAVASMLLTFPWAV